MRFNCFSFFIFISIDLFIITVNHEPSHSLNSVCCPAPDDPLPQRGGAPPAQLLPHAGPPLASGRHGDHSWTRGLPNRLHPSEEAGRGVRGVVKANAPVSVLIMCVSAASVWWSVGVSDVVWFV